MYYRTHEQYALRGWEKMPWNLVRLSDNSTLALTRPAFDLLLLCDGETNLSEDDFTDEMKTVLKQYSELGVILKSKNAQPINEKQRYRYYSNRYVVCLFWSLTGKCNFRCRHCYMDAPEAALGELTKEAAFSLIDQMAECGVLRVDITGGEPLIRRDFWEIIDRIRSKKIHIGMVYTNGWLLDEKTLDGFKQRGIKPTFSISFDGVGWHDWMRGIEGAETAAIRAIRLCKEKGFLASVEMCIHKGNYKTLGKTIEVLKKEGVYRLKVSNVMHTDLWCRNSEGLALSDQEYVDAMIEYIPEYFKDHMPMDLMISGVISLKEGSAEYSVIAERYDGTPECKDCYLCGATRYACYITPEGRMLPCMPMTASPKQEEFPLVKDIGLKQGLSDSYYLRFVSQKVEDIIQANKKCAECPYVLKCGGGCRARALVEGDSGLMGCDEMQCMLWQNEYPERIRRIADAAIAEYCK